MGNASYHDFLVGLALGLFVGHIVGLFVAGLLHAAGTPSPSLADQAAEEAGSRG